MDTLKRIHFAGAIVGVVAAIQLLACGAASTDPAEERAGEAAEALGAEGQGCLSGLTCNTGLTCCAASGSVFSGHICRDLTDDPQNCGGCGTICAFPPQHATSTCVNSACGWACQAGWGDCNPFVAGCETDVTTSLSNCGACGNACTNAHGTTSCSAGACAPVCSTGWKSCDGNQSNGCETNITTSNQHCGACNAPCGTGYTCQSGTCVGKPDLTVLTWTLTDDPVNNRVIGTAVVKNIGTATSPSLTAGLTIHMLPYPMLNCFNSNVFLDVPQLSLGATASLTTYFSGWTVSAFASTCDSPSNQWEVTVDVNNVVVESNEANNVLHKAP